MTSAGEGRAGEESGGEASPLVSPKLSMDSSRMSAQARRNGIPSRALVHWREAAPSELELQT
eukprot:CAMPEP_0183566258 /NCGR_PEP_ID=MMETSP0371-20130417/111390_1 /TAXON_ID=268820 /ORGANISM="Peridinium aciculiferum, Strain PAER-2" /LENGTH=61 /DNA_ID=CAMNT_0025775521 /DNA_START=61 /DNA_END=242 /DNA_ORIENTATION=+